MFDLFRFILVRPPQELEHERSIPSETGSDFQRKLQEVPNRARRKAIAIEFIRSPRYVKTFADLSNGAAFLQSAAKLEAMPAPNAADTKKLITEVFGFEPKDLIARETFKTDRERTADSLVAAKLVSRGDSGNLSDLVAVMRLCAIIERLAQDDEKLKIAGAVKEALARKIRLPEPIANAPDTREPKPPPPAPAPKDNSKLKELQDKLDNLDHAVRTLAAIPTTDFVGIEPECPKAPSSESVRNEVLMRIREAVAPEAAAIVAAKSGVSSDPPAEPKIHPLAVSAAAMERISDPVKTLLRERRIDLERTSLPVAVARLETERDETGRSLAMMEIAQPMSVTGIGNAFIVSPDSGVFLAGQPKLPAAPLFSNIRPSGTADLLVVKQQIKRYEAGEVGHIENILKGEFNEHTVRRSRTTEETQLQETETTQEEERDLQSTEHFELKTEVDKTVKEDASLKAGASLSGSYGGMIDFKTYVDGALSTSTQESTKQASAYAKDVTTRSATKVSQRIRQQITRRTLEQFEETTKHGFDNANGAGHVIGIYQWVDKIYEAQVWNYGIRLLFDVLVPEPAAFFINALAQQKTEGESLEKPLPFTLNPSQITETNYHIYVARYGATGIDAPPPMYRTVAKVFDERSDNPNPKTKTAELSLEAGYRAITGVALFHWSTADNTGVDWQGAPHADGTIGTRWLGGGGSTALDNEEGQIPISYWGYRIQDFTATFEITTKRTDGKLEAWKLKTHGSIQQAYLKAMSDYEQKLANLKAQTAGIQGHNPARNRSIEKNELKRSALAILTQRAYETFDAIDEFSPGAGQPDLFTTEPEGKYVRFFEQAFEWDQVMYIFYPYFWGRASTWHQRLLLDDADPQFADFLQSGWARVTIPVRPWFEKAVAHYLETGEIWDGGDVPDINSPLYVSILTEVEEKLNKPGEEKPHGDPWDVRLPTTLVRLRPDAELPRWKKQPDGTWVPDN